EVLDGLLPLLQAVPPQDLSNTLGALAQGFSGRGEEFGFTLDRLEQIFGSVNTELPALQDGLRGLADFSETYSDAGPQLVNALDNLRVTGNTVVEKQGTLAALYASGGASAASTAALLENNREQVISFAADSREALQVFARSSPTFGCMLGGFARTAPAARDIIAPDDPFPGVRANVQFTNPKGRYLPNQDEPRLLDDRPPACYDGYKLAGEFFPQYPGGSSYNDGSYQPPSRNPGETWFDALPAPPGVPDQVPGWGEPSPPVVPVGAGAEVQPAAYAGSAIERETLQVVYAEAGGIEPDDVPGWTTAVGAPALRGAEVSIR
ncbi:MCE family protein, partial [Rhodococcus rhodnii]